MFIGETDPIQAENWMNVIHTAFQGSQLPNGHKTWFVSCMLQEAYQWLKTKEETKFQHQDINSITWADFMEDFN